MKKIEEIFFEQNGIDRRNFLKYFGLTSAGLLIGNFVPKVNIAAAKSIRHGGQIKTGILGPIKITSFDPARILEISNWQPAWAIYNSLVKFDGDMNVVPDLAKSWEFKDETTYVFHLHKGIMFHDGNECTADEVKYSIERIKDPKAASPGWEKFKEIQDIIPVDRYTVKIKTKKPFAPLLSYLTNTRTRSQIVSRKAIEKYGDEFGMHPVGTGPFKFKEWKAGNYVMVERFNNYFKKGLPYLKQIKFLFIPEVVSGITALQAGDIQAVNTLAPSMVKEIEGTKGIKFFRKEGLNFRFIMFNNKRPPFDDQKVRLAFAKSINRKDMIKAVLFNEATESRGPIPPAIKWAYDPTLNIQSYDPKKARELLAQSRYSKQELQRMNIKLEGFGSGKWKRMAEVGAYQISQSLGLNIQTNITEYGSLFERLKTGNYLFTVFGHLGPVEIDEYMYDHYYSTASEFNLAYGQNYSNKTVDKLLEQGRIELDLKKRAEIYRKAQRIIAEDAPNIFCFHANVLQAVSDQLGGFLPTAYNGFGAQFEEAYMKG